MDVEKVSSQHQARVGLRQSLSILFEMDLASLSNPLVTLDQLSSSSSHLDGLPAELESSIRFRGAELTQAAGVLLRLPQETIAQAIVIFTRFYIGPEGGSFLINSAKVVHSLLRTGSSAYFHHRTFLQRRCT